MGNEALLLRMLEPAVRPAGLPSAAKPSAGPIETRSFEELLAEADASPAPAAETNATSSPAGVAAAPSLLKPLAGIDHLENANLCRLLAPHAAVQE